MSSVEQFTLTRSSEGWKPVLTMCAGTFGGLLLTILLWHFTRRLLPYGVAAGIYMVLGLGSVVVPQLYLYTYPRRGAVTLSITPQAFTFTRDGESVRGRREELVLTYGIHRRHNRFVPASDTPVLVIALPSKRWTLSVGAESTGLRWQGEQRQMRSPTYQLPPSEFRQLSASLGLPLESTGQGP